MDGHTLTADVITRVPPWDKEELIITLAEAEKRFRRARDQVTHVDRKIRGLEWRYSRARDEQRRPFRYILRMRLLTTERVRDMYHDYARAKADEVLALRKELRGRWEDQEDDVTEFVDEDRDSDVNDDDDDVGDVDISPEDEDDPTDHLQ